jgi:hypothetical protein
MAEGAEAGDFVHASEFSLPAATATIIPAARMEAMPRFSVDEKPPPIDMLATHLLDADGMMHSSGFALLGTPRQTGGKEISQKSFRTCASGYLPSKPG